jgi:hypothetical protein
MRCSSCVAALSSWNTDAIVHDHVVEAELKSSGYTEIESKSLDPRPVNHGHTHDYDIRGLVLSGIFIVN